MSIQTEKQAIAEMIQLFCHAKHGTGDSLCCECRKLLEYAHARLDHCPFSDDKPVCRNCTIHCYAPDMCKKISDVMRYSGPRMLLKNPGAVFRHLRHALKKS